MRLLQGDKHHRCTPGHSNAVDIRRDDSDTIGVRPPLVNRNSQRVRWNVIAVLTLCALIARQAAAQSHEPLTEARVRALARQASRESRGDPTELVLALDRRVRAQWGDFESFPLSVVRNDDLLVTVSAPYMSFRRSLVDVLRSGRPIEQAVWTSTVVIEISPRRLGAPDLASVILSRDGQTVTPVRSTLRPMTFSNGAGEEGMIHAGEVQFAPSAFLPGAPVLLTLAPTGSPSIVYTFDDAELATLR